jgi:hypothetical protein
MDAGKRWFTYSSRSNSSCQQLFKLLKTNIEKNEIDPESLSSDDSIRVYKIKIEALQLKLELKEQPKYHF